MEYRQLKGLPLQPSLLGFGCMRFPTLESGAIDEAQATEMIDHAIASGVNYFDTAYFYHDGNSEAFVGKVLAKYPRDSYCLVSKLPVYLIHSLDDAKKHQAIQWERLQRDKLDIYLLHALDGPRWRKMVELGVVDWYFQLRDEGYFDKCGFSFHGSYEEFEEIAKARDWDVCQLQLNYVDTEEQAGIKGYDLATELGIPVLIMEPIKGGALANPPQEIRGIFEAIDPTATPASWAMRWAASLPNVVTVLSGMSTLEQVKDNLATYSPFKPLTPEELDLFAQAAELYRQRVKNGCTGCAYCIPCPVGIDIPTNFKHWNDLAVYQNPNTINFRWKGLADEKKAKHCIFCGKCEIACPQKISIRKDLVQVQRDLDELNP